MTVTGEVARAPVVPGVELGRVLARGGTSEVWEAVREADGRRVAVKVARADPDSVEAAMREASLAAAVAADHVLGVQACLPLADGRVALVMPLLRGGDLGALVRARGHLTPGEVVTVLAPLAGALGRLHGAGVVHGDVSPGNVLLDLDGRPVLADLGLGRVVGDEPVAVWGTEGYLAPEVLMGDEPSPASDVYALGALAWLCLSGAPPGAPGLRPGLAEVSRAGPAAARLVEVVSPAVGPHPQDRPAADELACALFDAAEPVPLHLVRGEDEVSAVTYRLRAAADGSGTPEVPRRRGRHTGARHRGPARRMTAPVRRRVLTGLAVVLALLAGGLVVAGAGVGNRVGDRGASRAVPTAPSAAAPVAGRVAPRTAAGGKAGVVHDRSSPREAPGRLLEALAAARAAAWRAADPALLAAAEAEGSLLMARDAAALAELRRGGLRYEGLGYAVRRARTVSGDDGQAVLAARLGTSGYQVVGAGERAGRPPTPGEEVLVDLRWTAGGWRLTGIRSPG